MSESWRLFWGIELPSATREALAAALAPRRRGAPGLRWTAPESWHITACFLGDVESARVPEIVAAGARAAARARPLELVLRGPGQFPERGDARVHWIGCAGELEALRAAATELALEMVGLGLPVDEKPLIPHVTIARAPRRGGREALTWASGLDLGAAAQLRAVDWVLYRSELEASGPRYRALARVPFDGS